MRVMMDAAAADKPIRIGGLLAIGSMIVGLALLWLVSRPFKTKFTTTIVYAVALLGIGMMMLPSLRREPVPMSGYNVAQNDRGYFISKRVFPKERDVFNQVALAMDDVRANGPKVQGVSASEIMLKNTATAYDKVAQQTGIPVDDVKLIYLKVSSNLQSK